MVKQVAQTGFENTLWKFGGTHYLTSEGAVSLVLNVRPKMFPR